MWTHVAVGGCRPLTSSGQGEGEGGDSFSKGLALCLPCGMGWPRDLTLSLGSHYPVFSESQCSNLQNGHGVAPCLDCWAIYI